MLQRYLEAIRRLLQNNNWKPNRTIHISFVPEEEVGGVGGMIEWIKTESFKELNIGFALDEGISNPEESFDIFYDERVINSTENMINLKFYRIKNPCTREYWSWKPIYSKFRR